MKDMLDQEVYVGDTIVYPGRQGSSCWLNVGKVVEFVECEHPYRDQTVTKIRIKTITKGWSGQAGKVVTISRTDRIVKIHR
jgi:hypothetical protein